MATGRPIVATNIEGFASVVTNGQEGLLVPPMTDRPLAEALLKLLKRITTTNTNGTERSGHGAEIFLGRVATRVLDYYGKTIEKTRRNSI